MSTYKTNKHNTDGVATSSSRTAAHRWLALAVRGLRTGRLLVLLMCLVMMSACNRQTPNESTSASTTVASAAAEQPWSKQVASVRAGASHEIKLEQTAVSSQDLADLSGLSELRVLILDSGVVRDEDASTIATLSSLEHLRLRESPLSDRGLAELAHGQLDSLIILNLPQATPTAAGLAELGKLPRLRQLRIGGKQIDDLAIAVLAQWPELTSLHLIGPGITEKSLQTIAGMPKLISFYLDDCALADSAWEELFRARPGLHVHIDQVHHDRDPNAGH